MHDSHLPLSKWFLAIYLMCESKKGISANQMKRTLGVSYKTSWYLCHRIREAMGNDRFEGPTLFGIVEVDEPLVGRKVKGFGRGYTGNKAWVACAIHRGGKIRIERLLNTRRGTIYDFIKRTIKDEAEAIYTDELKSYIGIADHNTRHEVVCHFEDEWTMDDAHTNSIEGVWNLFKRTLMGAFHKMSIKHMDRYIEELEWRYNNRNNSHIFRDMLARIVNTRPLEYQDLVA